MKTKTLLSLVGIIISCGIMYSSIDNPKKIFEPKEEKQDICKKFLKRQRKRK